MTSYQAEILEQDLAIGIAMKQSRGDLHRASRILQQEIGFAPRYLIARSRMIENYFSPSAIGQAA